MSTREDGPASVGDAGLAGAAGVVTGTRCCPGVAELRFPVSDAGLLPTIIGDAEAPLDAVVEAIVPASAAFA